MEEFETVWEGVDTDGNQCKLNRIFDGRDNLRTQKWTLSFSKDGIFSDYVLIMLDRKHIKELSEATDIELIEGWTEAEGKNPNQGNSID